MNLLTILRKAVCVLLLALAVTPQLAFAQDDKKQKDLTQLDLEDLMKVEIVTGASKFAQKVTEAPASVTIVTAEEIKRFGYRTLADVLKGVRGFYVNNDRNYSYVGVRGFARPGDYNSRVLLLVNGHRVNENIYDAGYYGTEGYLDVDLIEQIEIIRGPSSSLYGTNAFFAVINVITKKGSKQNGLEISADAGSFDTYRGRVSYGKKFDNGLDLMLSTSFHDSKGQRRLYFKEYDDPATNNGIAEDGDADRFHNFFGSVSKGYFTLQGAWYSREKGFPTGAFGTVFNDRRNHTLDRGGYADLGYERLFANGLNVTARLYYDQYYYTGDYVFDLSENETPLLAVNRDIVHGKWWGAETNITKAVAKRHKVTVGGEYRDNFQQDQRNFDVEPYFSYLDDRRDSKNWAVYAQDEFAISKKLLLNAGVRHDHYGTFGGTTNPRLGLIYNPASKTWVKLLYGQAFRAPNAYELYYLAPIYAARPRLEPESIKTSEAVLEQYIGDNFRLSASGYFYKIKNLISQQADPEDGAIFFRNAERIRAAGVELEFEARLKNGFTGRASYTYQKSEDEGGRKELVNSPRQMAYFNLSAPLAKQTFSSVELRYMGERKTLAGGRADDHWITNLTLLKQKIGKGLDVSFSLYNLFDQKYGDPGAEEHRQDVITQDGRTFRLKLSYSFGKRE